MAVVVSLALKVISPFQWGDLKKNGAWKNRFDAPYAPAPR
jgi:hypothetical protein